ncbi:MAG: 4Fe-4S dicluster domain-containing protein [Anaerolineales bacterium]|nr:4Fe-4S dicluster domain-containing protein [Anaerolineales bacterium]MDW8161910.1 4Fe-4S dicluster domain-containing protein [Anaerolineales bacterium]
MKISLSVENRNPLATLQNFLKSFLERQIVDVLLTPMRTPSNSVTPALVSDPALLNRADPLAPVLPVNAATWAGKISLRQPRPKAAAVLRPCEARALVELTKMAQASLDDLLVIALDCAGTYTPATFLHKQMQNDHPLWVDLYAAVCQKPESPNLELRPACQICEQPVFESAPIRLCLFESDLERTLIVEVRDEIAQKLNLTGEATNGRSPEIEAFIAARTQARDRAFAEIRARLEGEEGIAGVFAACIRCHNCMTVCPICYCKTCVFRSHVFDHDPMKYVQWARQKGAQRMPPDTMLFHLTRQNHMALSCVGCGMCTDACPSELPVGLVFRAVAQRLQHTFDYLPGRKVEEPLPLITFRADEWTEVGE